MGQWGFSKTYFFLSFLECSGNHLLSPQVAHKYSSIHYVVLEISDFSHSLSLSLSLSPPSVSFLGRSMVEVSSPLCSGYFGSGISWTICLGSPWTSIHLILASKVVSITGVSHQHLFFVVVVVFWVRVVLG
jgi:hypothetical protein